MNIYDPKWWLIILLNLFGFFVLRYSYISKKISPEIVKALGTIITTTSFILMLTLFGFINVIVLFLIMWILITPIVVILITLIESGSRIVTKRMGNDKN